MYCVSMVEYDLKEPIFFKRSGAEALLSSKDIRDMSEEEANIIHNYFNNCDKRLDSAIEGSYIEIWQKYKQFSRVGVLPISWNKFKILVDEILESNSENIFEDFDEKKLFAKISEEFQRGD